MAAGTIVRREIHPVRGFRSRTSVGVCRAISGPMAMAHVTSPTIHSANASRDGCPSVNRHCR